MTYEDYRKLPDAQQFNILRQTLNALRIFDCVDIHWERDPIVEEATDGEKSGRGWEIEISTKGRRVNLNGDDLIPCLIAAEHQASDAYDAHAKAIKIKRDTALAKLSPEERRLLGV